jgi:predicted lipoprotein with Yx(FWY)xxD motif
VFRAPVRAEREEAEEMTRKPLLMFPAAVTLSAIVALGTAVGGDTEPSATAVVKLALNANLKRAIVVDGRGRTLYMFTSDKRGTPTCTRERDSLCARVWPAFTSDGAPRAGKGIKASLLGTKLADGKQQVTYNRHPLYYFRGIAGYIAGDRKAGDVRGQGIEAKWWVLSPKGIPIRTTT